MERLFEETVAYWRRWPSKCTYHGRWRETVHRSALALKLLTFALTGGACRCGHRPRACSRPWGVSATGITATPGYETPHSLCTGCCASASPRRRQRSWNGSATRRWRIARTAHSTSCTASASKRRYTRRRSLTSKATKAPPRCVSAMTPRGSSSSTSTLWRTVRCHLPLEQIWCAYLIRTVAARTAYPQPDLSQLDTTRREHLGAPWWG